MRPLIGSGRPGDGAGGQTSVWQQCSPAGDPNKAVHWARGRCPQAARQWISWPGQDPRGCVQDGHCLFGAMGCGRAGKDLRGALSAAVIRIWICMRCHISAAHVTTNFWMKGEWMWWPRSSNPGSTLGAEPPARGGITKPTLECSRE